MKFKKTSLTNILIALLVATLIIGFSSGGFFKRLEYISTDFLFYLRGPIHDNPRIAIIEIDDDNILSIGRWPWERTWQAAIIQALNKFGAESIYLDMVFSEPSGNIENDQPLAEAIEESKNVYLPFVFQEGIIDKNKAFFPIDEFAKGAKGIGSINVFPDEDGVLRMAPLVFADSEGELYPHIALKMAMDHLGYEEMTLQPREVILSNYEEKLRIPLASDNEILVNWTGTWKETFHHYSFIDILEAYSDVLKGKEPRINVEPLKNSVCFVAVTAIGLYDIKPVPLEPAYPSVGLIVNAFNNLVEKQFVYSFPWWSIILLTYLFALIPALVIAGKNPLRETLIIILAGAALFTACYAGFIKGIWINYAFPLFAIVVSFIAVSTYNFVRISFERQRFFKLAVTDELTGLFNVRYFRMILKTEILMAKADPDKHFCVVMTDIDHFKKFNDTYGHQTGDLVLREVSEALKSPVRSSDVVARYGGEEMIVLLRGSLLENGMAIAEKLRKAVESRTVQDENNTYKVTISLGVAVFTPPNDDVESIIKRADTGLYVAKEAGRNQVSTSEKPSP